jgi:hypothetical protein
MLTLLIPVVPEGGACRRANCQGSNQRAPAGCHGTLASRGRCGTGAVSFSVEAVAVSRGTAALGMGGSRHEHVLVDFAW